MPPSWRNRQSRHKKAHPPMPDLAGYVLALVQERVGAVNAISAADLAAKSSTFYNAEITGRDVRQVIHNLRQAENPI